MGYSGRIKMLLELLIEISANADEVEQLDYLHAVTIGVEEGDDDRINRVVCNSLSFLLDMMVEACDHELEDRAERVKDVQALLRVLGLYDPQYKRLNPLPGLDDGG